MSSDHVAAWYCLCIRHTVLVFNVVSSSSSHVSIASPSQQMELTVWSISNTNLPCRRIIIEASVKVRLPYGGVGGSVGLGDRGVSNIV